MGTDGAEVAPRVSLNLIFSDGWKRVLARARPGRLAGSRHSALPVFGYRWRWQPEQGGERPDACPPGPYCAPALPGLLRARQMTRRREQEFRSITFSLPQAEIDHFFAQIDSGETAPRLAAHGTEFEWALALNLVSLTPPRCPEPLSTAPSMYTTDTLRSHQTAAATSPCPVRAPLLACAHAGACGVQFLIQLPYLPLRQ